MKQGFDTFFGYVNQVHGDNYCPEFLWCGLDRDLLCNKVQRAERICGGFHEDWTTERNEYSHDSIMRELLHWIGKRSEASFFLYLALTIPHANNERSRGTGDGAEVPDHGIYEDTDWPASDKGQAAMITRMD